MAHKNNLYDLYFWPDDVSSEKGQKYLEKTIVYFKELINSNLLPTDILEKQELNVLDICAGAGYGSLVFASLFPEKKINVLVTDSRDLLMESAKLAALLGINNSTFSIMDAKDVSVFNKRFDVVILYGLSTPHFSPKEAISLYSQVKGVLEDNGIFIVQEIDRRKDFFLDGNYHKKAYAEGYEEMLVSEEKGYDINSGMIEREYYSEQDPSRRVSVKSFLWSIAETDALLSLYWKRVDKVALGGYKYFLVASEKNN